MAENAHTIPTDVTGTEIKPGDIVVVYHYGVMPAVVISNKMVSIKVLPLMPRPGVNPEWASEPFRVTRPYEKAFIIDQQALDRLIEGKKNLNYLALDLIKAKEQID